MLNHYQLLISIVIMSFAHLSIAQVLVYGSVNHRGEVMRNVEVNLVIDGQVSKSSITNYKGKFEVELPLNVLSQLTFLSTNNVPLTVVVDTRFPTGSSRVSDEYEIPLNIEMFLFYESIETELNFKEPFGFIKIEGTGSETFQFEPNEATIHELIDYKKRSHLKEDQGLDPDIFNSIVNTLPSNIEKSTVFKVEMANEKEVEHAEIVARKITKDNVLMEAKNEELLVSRNKLQTEKVETESIENTQQDIQYLNKSSKSEVFLEYNEQLKSRANAIAENHNQDVLFAEKAGFVLKENSALSKVTVLKHLNSSNYFYNEEVFSYTKGNEMHTLRKTSYNWLFFVADYFYLNEQEITKDKYEIERAELF